MEQIIGTGEAAVKVVGLKKLADKKATFDGITLMLFGGAVENFSDLTITGGANNVRRVIWQGDAGGVNRNAVLIVDNDGDGTLKGDWLILGNEQNVLTYYTDAAKISTGEDAAITLQFPDKKAALTPRRFTFIEKTSAGDGAILSIGAAFDDVTISAGASNPVYFSRTADGLTKLNGVLQPKATAQVNSQKWKFDDADSFIVEGDEKIFIGDTDFDCASDLAACEIRAGKVLSDTTAIKIANVHYNKNSKSLEIRKELKKMAWTRTDDGGFAYNEGSLNFTLRGSAFHDSNGDGVPDGVTFENGRPVFMGIKNLRDFHFDVPRGFIIVNGNEYKLVDLDRNPENGEELQLFKENVGFPQGNDRTNPAAYEKVAENQFTYNEGSLHYTLTGGAFHDNDNNGIPDGVHIIGPKPCFGSDGTIFDTSVENFHFKVPSGSLMVNGERYQLAELDDNPDNGYELVVPEVKGKLGWTKIEGGFVYKRPADNNPDVMGGLKLFGKDLVDSNDDGEPDGVTVPTIIIGKVINGRRITQIGINGLHGEVFLNHPEAMHSFGVKGDANYNILITKDNGNLSETLFTDISPNATINITNDTIVVKTDGNGGYNFTGSGRFKLNDDFITMNGGERELKVQVKNGKIKSIDGFTDEDVVKVSKSGNIRINGKKITLMANSDMDMYGKPARTSGGDSGEDSGETAESGDATKVAGETQELTKTQSDLEYKSSDDAEQEAADFTISVKNLEDVDAVTVELVQKFMGADTQDAGEDLKNQNPAENKIDVDAPKISNVSPAADEHEVIALIDKKPMIISMENCKYVSSAGLRALLMIAKTAKARKVKVIYAATTEEVTDVLKMTGFIKMLRCVETVAEAEKELRG